MVYTYDPWQSWTTSTATTSTATDNVWYTWQPSYNSSSTATVTYGASTSAYTVWNGWLSDLPPITYQTKQLTPAEQRKYQRDLAKASKLAALQAARRQKQAERTARNRKLQEQLAERKATRLLLSLLNREQKAEYNELKQITINHPNTKIPKFTISSKLSGNVVEHDETGKPIFRHCVYAPNVPMQDHLATQVLYLETHPELLLAASNRTAIH